MVYCMYVHPVSHSPADVIDSTFVLSRSLVTHYQCREQQSCLRYRPKESGYCVVTIYITPHHPSTQRSHGRDN